MRLRGSRVCLLLSLGLVSLLTAASSSQTSGADSIESSSYASYLTGLPTGARATYYYPSTTINLVQSVISNATNFAHSIASSGRTNATLTSPTTSATRTTLEGTYTRTVTSEPSSQVKCNGYTEFCDRKYSNVTYVVAHNSPFHVHDNAASNQVLDVVIQLNDGVRGIQSETHYVNNTVMLCHTSCDELNAGTLEAYLTKVKAWLDGNRFEVITILLGNEDYIDPGNYTAPFTNSGVLEFVYTPPTQPMDIKDWPLIGDMILRDQRVVVMLEYDANQQKIPWLLDMWSYQWQTPFSPTDVSFPCTVQRPPGQDRAVSEKRLMLANHNLNVQLDVQSLGIDILIPDTVALTNTNANTTTDGAAFEAIKQCTAEWGRPPNYLLVDYYNVGNFNGSSLAAAAQANNVTYNVNSCCGLTSVSAATSIRKPLVISYIASLVFVLGVIR